MAHLTNFSFENLGENAGKKCKIREKTQQIKCPDPQGDGGRLESQCDPSSLMVAAVGTVAVLVDDTGGDSLGEGAGSGSWRVLCVAESVPPGP